MERIEASKAGSEGDVVGKLRREIRQIRFAQDLRAYLDETREVDSALRYAVRASMEQFGAESGAMVAAEYGGGVVVLHELPRAAGFGLVELGAVIRGDKVQPDGRTAFARVRRRGRSWGVLVLRRKDAEFTSEDRSALARAGAVLSGIVASLDRERIAEVRARIDRKILSQLGPIDLAYQILHGLRSLTRYDHSSTVWMATGASEGRQTLEVVAEQIAFRKGKSDRIGKRVEMTGELADALAGGPVLGLSRDASDAWVTWEGRALASVGTLLWGAGGDVDEGSVILAPLRSKLGGAEGGKEKLLGVIKVSSRHRESLGAYELELLKSFTPYAAIAVANSNLSEAMRSQMVSAEKKHVMADIARGVAHDVNNALGSVVPLIQQLAWELAHDQFDPKRGLEDMEQIDRSLRVCQRVFRGMLDFSRRTATRSSEGEVEEAIRNTLAVIGVGLASKGVEVRVQIEAGLPAVAVAQSDLEQLALNLLSNGRDALTRNGVLEVLARVEDGQVRLEIRDNGGGVPPEVMARIWEPFFTTKSTGTGLGLSICRSIVTQAGGRIDMHSELGVGTSVVVWLPVRSGAGTVISE